MDSNQGRKRRVRSTVRPIRDREREGGHPTPIYLSWVLLAAIMFALYALAGGEKTDRTIAVQVVYLPDRETVTEIAHLFCDLGVMGENARLCHEQVALMGTFIPPSG